MFLQAPATDAIANVCTQDTVICAPIAELLNNVGASAWAPLIASAITILVIVIIAFIARNLVHRLIKRVVGRAASGPMTSRWRKTAGATEGIDALLHERRKQRAETIGSVLGHVATIVILGTAVLTVMERLTIPIAPLLTSVGIVGVALGFGAQELVKDFIAGMFMLLEDQYGVGDVVDVGTAVGTVEAVTLRITRLRDADGRVWYVRNGTIARVGNESQGWSRAYLDVPVAYTSEITTVKEVLEQVADQLWDDGAYREKVIVDRPDVFGVEQMSDSSLVFRISVKTLPSQQAAVARELRLRVKSALDEAGIALAA
ncbi:mechanosensitive ion channel family protein [Nonomuraea soli]|uniref:Small conductance mechanosensitive channel n=1 Tax=Nonomuraea soli TaxID=1032476 RepID=A0A7W0CM36_9ACTN|nr:mechanosensitive ion channel family protein [Nonomuraea soli]MBA2893477.1 small conductance mechanosensitive channel [Nonomuraea soli]